MVAQHPDLEQISADHKHLSSSVNRTRTTCVSKLAHHTTEVVVGNSVTHRDFFP